MVSMCVILTFTGAAFSDSTDFMSAFDPTAILPGDPVAVYQISLSDWNLLPKRLQSDPMDGAHPMCAVAGQSTGPLFDILTAPFAAFFALLARRRFARLFLLCRLSTGGDLLCIYGTVLITLFAADTVYSHFYPNQGAASKITATGSPARMAHRPP